MFYIVTIVKSTMAETLVEMKKNGFVHDEGYEPWRTDDEVLLRGEVAGGDWGRVHRVPGVVSVTKEDLVDLEDKDS